MTPPEFMDASSILSPGLLFWNSLKKKKLGKTLLSNFRTPSWQRDICHLLSSASSKDCARHSVPLPSSQPCKKGAVPL